MPKRDAANTCVKRDYFDYLKAAQRRDDPSIDPVAKVIARIEETAGHKDLKRFHREQAKAFRNRLSNARNARTGKPLARATAHSTLLAFSSGCRVNRDTRAGLPMPMQTISHVRKRAADCKAVWDRNPVLNSMQAGTDIEKRNRALIAIALLAGARGNAEASLKLKHMDLVQRCGHQGARDVRTLRCCDQTRSPQHLAPPAAQRWQSLCRNC